MRGDWEVVRLGRFATHEKGVKPKNQKKIKDEVFRYPYVNIEAFEKGIVETYTDGEKCRFCVESDFLMVWDGSRSGLVGKGMNGALGSTLVRINFPGILNQYAFHFLKSKYQEINTRAKGSGTPHVDPNLLWNYSFPIAPLPEQRAIVAKIEALFSDLDKAEAELKKAQEQLKVYRQAVLKKAFEGELTKEWREKQSDLVSADDLLMQIKENHNKTLEQQITKWEQVIQENGRTNFEGKKPTKPKALIQVKSFTFTEMLNFQILPDRWVWVKSGELFNYVTSGSRGWAKYYSTTGGIFIRITNLNFDTLELDLNSKSIQFVNPPVTAEGLRTKVQKGDFLFSITGYLGMFAIAPDLEEAYVNQHVALARPSKLCNSKYLGYWIISKTGGYFYLNKKSKGATKAGLGLDDICEFPVPLCPILEQHQVVQEIESRLSVCDRIEQTISESLESTKSLRQSILKKAFEGTLLSEAELEACRKESDWEPARELLKKIKNSG